MRHGTYPFNYVTEMLWDTESGVPSIWTVGRDGTVEEYFSLRPSESCQEEKKRMKLFVASCVPPLHRLSRPGGAV